MYPHKRMLSNEILSLRKIAARVILQDVVERIFGE